VVGIDSSLRSERGAVWGQVSHGTFISRRSVHHGSMVEASDRSDPSIEAAARSGFSGFQVFGIVVAAIAVSVIATVWVVHTYVFPTEFSPVELSDAEQRTLDGKIDRLEKLGASGTRGAESHALADQEWLESGAYTEDGADREITFTERELNALIAGKTDMGRRAAIDLSDDLASARLLIPVDPDFPILGGRTLRVSAGVEIAYDRGRPIVVLRGVSLMGVPLPNAWLGNLKNVDLVERYGNGDSGFWRAFAAGVEHIAVDEGRLKIRLRE